MGRLAFAYAPFSTAAGDNAGGDSSDSDSDDDDQDADALRKRGRAKGIQRIIRYRQRGNCPHCDADDRKRTDDGPWHLILECDHPRLAGLRADMLRSLRRMLIQLLDAIHQAQERAGSADMDEQHAADRLQLRALTDNMQPTTADVRHAAFHMLAAVTWSATAVPDADAAPLSRWLGHVFDRVTLQRRFRRKIANHVIRWSNQWILAFAGVRGELLRDD
jgi:uncharacterized protein (DUF2267 family)